MAFSKERRIASLRSQIAEQRRWMEQCGGNLAGYIMNYGSKDDAEHSGNGGEAIYAADANALGQLVSEYEQLTGHKP